MSNEIVHDTVTNLTLYAARWKEGGNVFLSNPATDEVWGTGGRDADDYDIPVPEKPAGKRGHYVGDFASGGSIAAGLYYVTLYKQIGANPADSDPEIARGWISWDGSDEITLSSINTKNRQRKGPFV